MPGVGVSPLAFVALVPWFAAQGRSRRMLPGLVCGALFAAVDLRWLLTLMRFTPLVALGYAALVALLGASFGLLGVLIGWSRERFGDGIGLLVVAPIAYAAFEIVRAQGELGLGFSTAYSALARVPQFVQVASLLGPWALTAAIVFVNGTLTHAAGRSRAALLAAGAAVGLLAAFGVMPISPDGEPVDVSIVGSDVRQEIKLQGSEMETLLPYYLDLGRQAADHDPDLIVFPESILPAFILRDPELLGAFSRLAESTRTKILLGTGHYEDGEITNRVALLTEDGQLDGTYAMMHPVPFGETVPGRALLERLGLAGWLRRMLPLDLSRGTEYSLLQGIGAPICFESTFPQISRQFVRRGATLLVTVTNDAWFSGSSELQAHFASAVFRAVENRRYTLQAANGGISGIVDPRGRILASAAGETVINGSVAHRQAQSAYVRYGDAPLLVLFAVALCAAAAWHRASGDRRLPQGKRLAEGLRPSAKLHRFLKRRHA